MRSRGKNASKPKFAVVLIGIVARFVNPIPPGSLLDGSVKDGGVTRSHDPKDALLKHEAREGNNTSECAVAFWRSTRETFSAIKGTALGPTEK